MMSKGFQQVTLHATSAFRAAFSLVELSIVLVILGLLAGGILTGQSLIRAAELRSVVTEYNSYQTAVNSFKDKYFGLPGDLSNATEFWGKAATCPPTIAAPLTTQATCNGDGDWLMESNVSSSNEQFMFWQHLKNAGLVEGNFSGTSAHSIYSIPYSIPGQNTPISRLSNAGWTVWRNGESALISQSMLIEGVYRNFMMFGGPYENNPLISPVLKPEEAWKIDTKMDDGEPGRGKIVMIEYILSMHPQCYLLSDGSPGSFSTTVPREDIQYNLINQNVNCIMIFRDVF